MGKKCRQRARERDMSGLRVSTNILILCQANRRKILGACGEIGSRMGSRSDRMKPSSSQSVYQERSSEFGERSKQSFDPIYSWFRFHGHEVAA